jgi:hypothetical protein
MLISCESSVCLIQPEADVFDPSGVVAYVCPIPGTILCFLVLVAYAVTACFPEAWPHLDRVTFRLLTYAMVFK